MTLRRSPQPAERVSSDPASHALIQPRPHDQMQVQMQQQAPAPLPYPAPPYPYPYNPGPQQPPPPQQGYAVHPGYSPYSTPQRHSPYAPPVYARGYPPAGSPPLAIPTGLPASPYAARGVPPAPSQYNPYPPQQSGHYQQTIQTGPYPSPYPVPPGSYGSTSPQSSTATAPDGGSPTTNPAGGPVRRGNKTHVPSACINCKKAHLACDMSRPCRRCVSLNKHDTCIDIKHKKRGRPKIVKDAKKQDSSPVSSQTSQEPKSSWSQSQMAPVPAYALSSSSASASSGYAIPPQPPIDDGPLITIYASFDNIACGRVSDECLQLLGFYPQELAHQPLFDFVHHHDRGKLVRLVENLINACNSRHPNSVFTPTECISSSFPALFDMRPQDLLAIAPGSPIVTDTMRMRQRNESFDLMTLRMYIGGALGADIDRRETLSRAYLVISLAKAKSDVSPRSSMVTEYAANVSATGYQAYPQQYGQYAPANPQNTPLYASGFGPKGQGPAGPAPSPTAQYGHASGQGQVQVQGPLPPLLPRPQSAPSSAVTPPNQHTAIPAASYRYNTAAPGPQPSYGAPVPVPYPYQYQGGPPVQNNYYDPRPQAPLYAHPPDAGYYHTKQPGVGAPSMAPPAPSNTPRGNTSQSSRQSVSSGESDEVKRHPVHS